MAGDISQTGADLSFELGIWMLNEGAQEWDGSSIDYLLSEFSGMFANFRKSGSRNSFESGFGFLNTKN